MDDLVRFVELVVNRQQDWFLFLNCGAGRAVAMKGFVAAMAHLSGRPLAIEHDLSQPTIQTSLCLDCGKADRTLGWTLDIALVDGIRRTLIWCATTVLLVMSAKPLACIVAE